MPVLSVLISGPRRSGKSTLARYLAEHVLDRKPHYLRLEAAHDSYTNAVWACEAREDDVIGASWASAHRVSYTHDRLFETIPEGLRAIRRQERDGFAIVEADADPTLRHAYPYEYRIFIMTAPPDIYTIFRTPDAAAAALHQVLQDTAAFASEIFGLFDDDVFDDSIGVEHSRPSPAEYAGGTRVERLNIAEAQIRHFLSSPLGAEIASRIQLQPDYHALVEADVVIVNAKRIGRRRREVLDECVSRLQKLLSRIRQDARRQSVLYWGDIRSDDAARRKLTQRLQHLLLGDT
ncbi:MAG TPA: hypothetical protein PL151_02190 [Phycisphaerae bacterium]|nr:hypothetical protein [Phycisphaerae bacterium]HOJ73053.1 hypothetical protein [Phycisphaerae bacterium]HOM52669.1 hypothetical protein [Phycisphaerae bacterium]HON67602.1 hypothetical protein [Phycisphaerae bacterium]HOQ85076.1 hypothetical protein [Phycisphaerae bacterium]